MLHDLLSSLPRILAFDSLIFESVSNRYEHLKLGIVGTSCWKFWTASKF